MSVLCRNSFLFVFPYFSGTMYASGQVLCCQMEDKLTALMILAALPKPYDDGGDGNDDGDGDGGDGVGDGDGDGDGVSFDSSPF